MVKKRFSKVVFLIMICAGVVFFPISKTQAFWMDGGFAEQVFKQHLEDVADLIHGELMGVLKLVALEIITRDVNNMISGGSMGESLIIQDWDDFLVQAPLRESKIFVNDFFSQTTRGRSSALNYSMLSETSSGSGGNYYDYMVRIAKQNIGMGGIAYPEIDLPDYLPDPSNPSSMFDDGSWRGFFKFIEMQNNPLGYSLMTKMSYDAHLSQQMREAEIRGKTGRGYKDQTSGGYVTTPAATIADIQSNVLDLGNKIIASAQSEPEVMIQALLSKILNETIRQGIGNASSNVWRELEVTKTVTKIENEKNNIGNSPEMDFKATKNVTKMPAATEEIGGGWTRTQ